MPGTVYNFTCMKILFTLLTFIYSGLPATQTFVVRDIKSFGAKGDGKTNDHEAFQRAAAYFNARGGRGKLVLSKGIYIVGRQTVNLNTTSRPVFEGTDALAFSQVNDFTIEGTAGAVVKFAPGLRFGAFDAKSGRAYLHGNNFFADGHSYGQPGNAIYLQNCTNVTIKMLELDGNSGALVLGGVYGDTGIQIPHNGILVVNTTGLTVDKVYAHHFGLDGIMIGNNTGGERRPDKILLKNSRFEYNSRQGFSWIGGNDLTAIDCQFNHSGKGKFSSAPGAGVDIEAEVGPIKNGKFIRCEFVNNSGCGLVADSGPSSNCSFTDCTFWGVTAWSIWITKPGFKIKDSRIYGSFVHGFDAQNDVDATVFQNCRFEDKPYKGQEPFGNFLIETNNIRRLRFDNCTMIAHKKKIVWMESNPALKPEEKYQLNNCRLVFEGGSLPEGNWVSLTRNIRYRNCTFEIIHPEANHFYFNGIGENYNVDAGGNKYLRNRVEMKP